MHTPALRLIAPLSLTLALTLTACQGGSSTDSGTPAPPPSPPPPPTPTLRYTATALVDGMGGSIAPAAVTADAGSTAGFTVSADSGYVIATVSGCGDSLVGSVYTTAPLLADCTISAVFEVAPAAAATRPIHDTGVVSCGLETTSRSSSGDNQRRCDDPALLPAAHQDGSRGRDAEARAGTLAKIGASTPNANLSPALDNGFDYTKIAGDGSELPASALFWSCIRDNLTGLVWENKTDERDPNIAAGSDRGDLEGRDKDNSYSWYEPDASRNGGNAGTEANGVCAPAGQCDTAKAVATRNSQRLCGASDWRLPDIDELQSLVDHGRRWGAEPELSSLIDPGYFSHTQWFNATAYWSSTTTWDSTRVWSINFADGRRGRLAKTTNASLRLVRKPAP